MTHDILCLSGWAQPYDALSPFAPNAHHLDYAEHGADGALKLIQNADPKLAIGWSLGGVLLMIAKANKLIDPDWLVILGSPIQYVSDEDFPHGMGQETFARFYENMTNDPERSSEKFNHLLAYGDVHYESVMAALKAQTHRTDWSAWLPWLDLLASQHRDAFPLGGLGKMLLVYGAKDVIVSAEQGRIINKHAPKAKLEIWEDAAHALHLHDAARLQQLILEHTGYDLTRES